MREYYEFRFSGSGGQGIMLMGQILSEAAGAYEMKNVVQTRSYGPEARGGACRSEVIISQDPIDYLEVSKPNFLLALNQEAFDKYLWDLQENGTVVIDPDLVTVDPERVKGFNVFPVPVTAIAKNQVGMPVTANVVALGVMCSVTGVVSRKALESAVLAAAPNGTEKTNLKALAEGYKAASGFNLDQ